MKRYALSAIGRDTPGIVAAVTKELYVHGCNIEDSSMTRLEDEFAIILIMSMDPANLEPLEAGLRKIEQAAALTINLKEIEDESAAARPESNYLITLHGADAAGIVYKTSELLSSMKINITDLQTKRTRGRGDDNDIYIMLLEVFVPKDVAPDTLEAALKALGAEMGVTIKTRPVEEYEPL
jgi:glycine cleavage system transcriptional repressor